MPKHLSAVEQFLEAQRRKLTGEDPPLLDQPIVTPIPKEVPEVFGPIRLSRPLTEPDPTQIQEPISPQVEGPAEEIPEFFGQEFWKRSISMPVTEPDPTQIQEPISPLVTPPSPWATQAGETLEQHNLRLMQEFWKRNISIPPYLPIDSIQGKNEILKAILESRGNEEAFREKRRASMMRIFGGGLEILSMPGRIMAESAVVMLDWVGLPGFEGHTRKMWEQVLEKGDFTEMAIIRASEEATPLPIGVRPVMQIFGEAILPGVGWIPRGGGVARTLLQKASNELSEEGLSRFASLGVPRRSIFIGGIEEGTKEWKDPGLRALRTMFTTESKGPTTTISKKIFDARIAVEEKLTDKFAFGNNVQRQVRDAWKKTKGEDLPLELEFEANAAILGGMSTSGYTRAVDVITSARSHLKSKGLTMRVVDEYLVLKNLEDVLKMLPDRKIPTGKFENIDDVRASLQAMKTELGPTKFEEVQRAANEFWAFYAHDLDRKAANKIITRELADFLRSKHPHYNPIRYIQEEVVPGMDAAGRFNTATAPISVTDALIRRLSETGSELAVESPTRLIFQAAIETDVLIARNKAAKALVKLLQLHPRFADQIKQVSGVKLVAKTDEGLIFRRPSGEIKGTISYMEDGTRKIFEVPLAAERIAKTLALSPMGDLEKVARWANAIPRAALTQMNPRFFVKNFLFDVMTVAATRGVGLPSIFKAAKQILNNDETFKRMLKAGGDPVGFSGRSPEDIVKNAYKQGDIVIRNNADWQKYLSPRNILNTISEVGHKIELAPRLAVFNKEVAKGTPEVRAALAARRATVDFQRAGTAIRTANNFYLYLNASLQGGLLPFRAMRDTQIARYGIMGYMTATVAAYAWNRQFPEYRDLSPWEKYGMFVIMLPSDRYDKRGNKIPNKISFFPLREFALFSAPTIHFLERLDGELPEDTTHFLGSLLEQTNPLSSIAGDSLPVPMFFGEKGIEMALNLDVFRDRPIVGPELENLPPAEQFDSHTSEMAKRTGKWLGLSPKKIDFMLRMGAFQDLIYGADAAIRAFDEDTDPEIDALAAQLEDIQENSPPEEISRLRRMFLNDLDAATAKKVLEAERKPDPGIPVVTSMVNSFYRRTGGNNIFASRSRMAERETGISAKQTKLAAREISGHFTNVDRPLQEAIDRDLREGHIGHRQWLDASHDLGIMFRAKLKGIKVNFPEAGQIHDDPAKWLEYQRIVSGIGTSLEDARAKAQMLVGAYRAIPIPKLYGQVEDFETWFEKRDEFLEGLSKPDRKLLQDERQASMTEMEREKDDDFKVLRPYFEVGIALLKRNPALLEEYKEWRQINRLKGREAAKDFAERHPELNEYVKSGGHISQTRELIRKNKRDIDLLLRKWQFTTTYRHLENQMQELRDRAGVR